jgi:hypothetical protein
MSVKPVLLKDLRRTAVQQHQRSTGTGDYNRFSPLAPRERTFSYGKRKLPTDDSGDSNAGSAPKAPKFDSSAVFAQLKGQDEVLEGIREQLSNFEKVVIPEEAAPAPTRDAINFLGNAMKLLLKSQSNLTSVLVDVFKFQENPPTVSAIAQKPSVPTGKNSSPPVTAPAPAPDPAKRVKQALREAEKKLVMFNLDLGKVPTMNRDTLARKVTLALSAKASAGEHDYDVKDAEDVIDDILSCTKLEFLGTQTKKFENKKNAKDARNNNMCTVPVRFEFKDKDTRTQAEISIRKICKVSCAVPYPKRLRTILDKLVQEGKQLKPGCYIRTKVNIESLTVSAMAKTPEGWTDLKLTQNIPLDILETVTNTVSMDEQMTIS